MHGDARVAPRRRQYTVFGKVEEGLDVLDEIASIECEFGPGGEKSKSRPSASRSSASSCASGSSAVRGMRNSDGDAATSAGEQRRGCR